MRRLLILVMALGCASPGSYRQMPAPLGASDALRACIESAESQQYLERMHARIKAKWKVPKRLPAHEVLVRIRVDDAGNVAAQQILEAPDHRAASLVADAIKGAEPFGPLPAGSRCLSRSGLKLRFSADR